jgi:hypothetical protein
VLICRQIQLSAAPKGNGYQATVTFPDGVSISSAETHPTIAEEMTAAPAAGSTRSTGSPGNLLDTPPPKLKYLFDGFGGLVIRGNEGQVRLDAPKVGPHLPLATHAYF